jgi:ankyrin repeat protein
MITTLHRKKAPFRRKTVEERQQEVIQPLENFDYSSLAKILWEELSEAFPNLDVIKQICQFPIVSQQEKEDGSIALHVACYNTTCLKSFEIIDYLINLSPDSVKHQNKYGLVPLHKAVSVASDEHLEVVKMLIDRDLSTVVKKTNDGHTPLHLAVSVPKKPCLELIEYLTVINPKLPQISDGFGHLRIHKAVSRSKVDLSLVELLIHAFPQSIGMKDLQG